MIDYLDLVAGWKEFVGGELDESNKRNKKTLGGSTRPQEEDPADDDNGYDVQMDKIMARFNSFNQILSQNSNTDDDDDDDDDEGTQDEVHQPTGDLDYDDGPNE